MSTVLSRRLPWLLTLLGMLVTATADRPLVAGEPACEHGECCAISGIPMLSKLPYLNRVFRNMGFNHLADVLDEEPIGVTLGVDFDFLTEGPRCTLCCDNADCCENSTCCQNACSIVNADHGCEKNCHRTACAESALRANVAFLSACCDSERCQQAGHVCGENECACVEVVSCSNPCCDSEQHTAKCSAQSDKCRGQRTDSLMTTVGSMELVGLHRENASLNARLEMCESMFEQQANHFDAMQEATQAIAEVQEEGRQERSELVEALVEAHVANARLEAKLELAEQREGMLRELIATQLENEKLKHHVEMLARRAEEKGVQLTEHTEPLTPKAWQSQAKNAKRRTNQR